MKRRPKIQAWAVVYPSGAIGVWADEKWAQHIAQSYDGTAVKLVPYVPTAVAVVRAARFALELLQRPKHPHNRAESAIAVLTDAVARHEAAQKRGKR